MSAVLRPDCRDWTAYSGSGRWVCYIGHAHTAQEYVGVGVQGPAYLGFRPADGLSVEIEEWTSAYQTPLGRTCLNKEYETRGSERVV